MLSPYRIMWLYVMFDLPVMTKKERDAATAFRNNLLNYGFKMAQFSVYYKYCSSVEKSDSISRQMKPHIPLGGKVDILTITDKQFSNMERFYGITKKKVDSKQQLHLF